MMHLQVNDQMEVYKSSHCCCRLNITRVIINKAVIRSTAIFVAIDNNTLYGFLFYAKNHSDIKIMFYDDIPTVNISKRNY